jgi:UDP-sugar transporter A1/2/3
VRNVQLGLFGIVIGLGGCYMNDWGVVSEKGFFHGYNSMVWFVICVQAIGGLIVAAVVKYADNVLKGLATSLSILLSALVSTVLFDFGLTTMFLVGAVAVISAVFLYGMPTDKMQGVGPFGRFSHLDDSGKKHKDDEAQPIPPA